MVEVSAQHRPAEAGSQPRPTEAGHYDKLVAAPVALSLGLAALAVIGPGRDTVVVMRTLLGAARALGVWHAWLLVSARHASRTLTLEI